MGKHLMKEAPDVDFYVEWSSVVESPTFAGTRAEMLAHLRSSTDPWLRTDAPHHPEQRLSRVDKTGTSSLWVTHAGMRDKYAEEGAWDDTGTIYQQLGYCSRVNIFELARRLLQDSGSEVRDLLAPFEDGCRCHHEYASHGSSGCSECECLMRPAASS